MAKDMAVVILCITIILSTICMVVVTPLQAYFIGLSGAATTILCWIIILLAQEKS